MPIDFDTLEANIKEAVLNGCVQFGFMILNTSLETCPVDTGNMRDTGQVQEDDEQVVVSYGPAIGKEGYDYCIRQHEDASLFHDNGKEDHWLERAGFAHLYGDGEELKEIISSKIQAIL